MENGKREKRWAVRNKRGDSAAIAKKYGISQVLAQVIINRGITGGEETEAFLRCSVKSLHSPSLLPDIDRAAWAILEAVKKGKKIRVIGDYDVDGICSTYILWKVLGAMGADVDAVLPHRIKDGYGISESMVMAAHEDGVSLVVTCDNGIAASGPLRMAKGLGMQVVVTDHHEVPFEQTFIGTKYLLPPASAVVDPKIPAFDPKIPTCCTGEPPYPFPEICGAAVALKLCMHMRSLTGPITGMDRAAEREMWKEAEAFCALATVCDVMPLQDENRVMVKRGLAFMASTKNAGLRALIDACGLTGKKLTSYHLGFVIGPCMNASGRLDTAELALGMFQTKDREEAMRTANRLVELNNERKSMTEKGLDEALMAVETTSLAEDKILVIHLPDCHESLAGIIAGKVKEYWHRPTIVFTGHGTLKGSGRSIESYHMYDKVNTQRQMLLKFGGHAMAAGMSIEEDKLAAFREAINRDCALTEDDLAEKVIADMAISPTMFNIRMVEEFEMLEPCGTKNPKPVFMAGPVKLVSLRVLGKNRNVLKFIAVDEEGGRIDLVKFGKEQELKDLLAEKGMEKQFEQLLCRNGDVRADIAYFPEVNEWDGARSLQFVIKDWRLR